jgi:hypothetical protein
MQGILLGNNKKVEVRGRVEALYCPAAGWEDRIDLDNLAAARRTGYTLECKTLRMEETPLDQSQSFWELTASQDATIDNSNFFGKAQSVKYNQAKNMVYLDGNVYIKTSAQGETKADSIHYNIETRRFEIRARGMSIGQ